jgi:membrane protease YdiL (CAAX protease family)
MFNLPRKNTGIWLLLFFAYPVLSAYSQEVVFRTFLFTRYLPLFKSRNFLIIISGVTFAFAHIVYYHPLSMLLTFFAGIYLAWIYKKTRSVLFTTILHSILGILIFTIGLGEYFWLNMDKHL